MNAITRRSLILSGAALAAGAFARPRRSRDRIDLDPDRQRRLHLRRFGRQRNPALRGARLPAEDRRDQRRRDDRRLGHRSRRNRLHLRQPADIEGIYSAIGAGLSVAGGRSVAQLTNARGVVLKLHGRQMGLMFSIDLSGMSISLA